MNIKYKISFPHMGNYYIPITNLLDSLIDKNICKIIIPKKITSDTIIKGSKQSPDFACIPFKYNMGNFIESLDQGANVLIQAGGGCRYGYYYELQEKALKDLGYDFTFIPLVEENVDVLYVYNKFKMLNPKLSFKSFCYHFLLAFKCINVLDKYEEIIRSNYALQVNKNDYELIHKKLLSALKHVKSFNELHKIKKVIASEIKKVELNDILESDIKIGIIGELYTSMEPYSSFFLEKELLGLNVILKRYTTASYLLFQKSFNEKKVLKKASKYITYHIGADGPESIAHAIDLAENKFDGLIHIKPFGCAPEINAIPMLRKISNDYNIPIMYLTFDEETSSTGIKTRIEAFYDMLKMKKEAHFKNGNLEECI